MSEPRYIIESVSEPKRWWNAKAHEWTDLRSFATPYNQAQRDTDYPRSFLNGCWVLVNEETQNQVEAENAPCHSAVEVVKDIPLDAAPDKRNPLPCGCGIMGTPYIASYGSEYELRQEYKDKFIKFCPTHAAAPALLVERDALLAERDALIKTLEGRAALEMEMLSEVAAENNKLTGQRDSLVEALKTIAELEGDCPYQKFRLTRFQVSQVARAALSAVSKEEGE